MMGNMPRPSNPRFISQVPPLGRSQGLRTPGGLPQRLSGHLLSPRTHFQAVGLERAWADRHCDAGHLSQVAACHRSLSLLSEVMLEIMSTEKSLNVNFLGDTNNKNCLTEYS